MIELEALEQSLAQDLAADASPRMDTEAMLKRVVDRATSELASKPRRRFGLRMQLLLAAALVLGVGASVAAVARHRHAPARAASIEAPPIAASPQTTATMEVAAPSPPPPMPTTSSEQPQVAAAAPATAADLFSSANLARREGRDAQAVRLYRDLETRYPRSEEASVAHAALGRLLLDRQGDAAGALVEFDRYLARGPSADLREEALMGRALALGRLGRAEEERRAWQALLAERPSSIYAERARRRLQQLGP
jgi:TolA-binding protein